jgi:streptomycin 6-kinase
VEPPAYLDWMAGRPDTAAWLGELPALVDRAVERWDLTLGEPYAEGGTASYTVRVTTPDGTPAVLKVAWPHRETEHEAAALQRWDGEGAIRLLAHDADDDALLLERAEPGHSLLASPADVAAGEIMRLVQRLAVPVGGPFTLLEDEAAHWAEGLRAGRTADAELADHALGLIDDLLPTPGPPVLLHQDLHAGNVLAAEREPWLAIDPKPLAGEKAFAVAPLVRDHTLGHTREAVRRRLDRACEQLDLDRERARGWTIVQTVAWAGGDEAITTRHVQTARWLIE